MFVPLYDTNGLEHIDRQYVTISLIVINVAVWLVTSLGATEHFAQAAAMSLGFIPSVVLDHARLDPSLVLVNENWTFITYAFLHGDWTHIAFNMLFLWVFGDNVEDAMGHVRFLLFYLACAAAGAAMHAFFAPLSDGPLIGASGAVSGVVAAYFLLHPKVRVWVLVFWRIPLPLPAAIPLAFWIGQQFYMLVVDDSAQVSFAAHIGGILAGALLIVVFRRRGVPLFDQTLVSPKAVHHAEVPVASESADGTKPEAVSWGRSSSS